MSPLDSATPQYTCASCTLKNENDYRQTVNGKTFRKALFWCKSVTMCEVYWLYVWVTESSFLILTRKEITLLDVLCNIQRNVCSAKARSIGATMEEHYTSYYCALFKTCMTSTEPEESVKVHQTWANRTMCVINHLRSEPIRSYKFSPTNTANFQKNTWLIAAQFVPGNR